MNTLRLNQSFTVNGWVSGSSAFGVYNVFDSFDFSCFLFSIVRFLCLAFVSFSAHFHQFWLNFLLIFNWNTRFRIVRFISYLLERIMVNSNCVSCYKVLHNRIIFMLILIMLVGCRDEYDKAFSYSRFLTFLWYSIDIQNDHKCYMLMYFGMCSFQKHTLFL